MKLTQEQFNCIAEYESDFGKALNENYFRIVNRKMLLEYDQIYRSVFGRESKILNGCNRCVLSDIKMIARVYFEDKAELEAKKNEEVAVENKEEEEKPKKMSQYTYGDKKETKKTTNKKK